MRSILWLVGNDRRRSNQALVRALEDAQAEAHRVSLTCSRAQRDLAEARANLEAVIRGIDTAPMSTIVTVEHPTDLNVRAPHTTWAPLDTALVDAKRFLAGHRRG